MKLSNEIVIMWDGKDRIDVKAPPSLKGKTKGLCGTYDGKQNNDFLTPTGIVETNPNIFGNQWKSEKSCVDVSAKIQNSPCENEVQRKEEAKRYCKVLTGEVFQGKSINLLQFGFDEFMTTHFPYGSLHSTYGNLPHCV